MRFLIAVQGSYGDINPCAGVGVGLRDCGHEVVFLTSGYYQEWLQRLGFETVPTVSREDYLRITSHPDFTHPLKAYRLLWNLVLEAGRLEYEAIRDRFEPGRTLVITRLLNLGSRIAAEKHGVPLLHLNVSPDETAFLRRPDVLKGLIRAEAWRKTLLWFLDRRISPSLNQLRLELDLAPVDSWFSAADHQPQSLLALFPEWYAVQQPKWPLMRYAGFPLFDGAANPQLGDQVDEFLTEGDPPIVISAFSVNQTALEYFQSAVSAVERIGARAVLLSSFPGNVPPKLPSSIGYFGYVPLQQLLPRAAAIIHQGGIGSVAAALRAGVPQLVVPLNFDNAPHGARVRHMGVGSMLRRRQFQPDRVAKEIENLMTSPRIKERCSHYAAKLRNSDGIRSACRIIEYASRQLAASALTNSGSAGRSARGAY